MGGMGTDWSSSRSYDWSSDNSVSSRSARSYAQQDQRKYTGGKGLPVKSRTLETESPLAGILGVDTTGSMRTWPQLIFEKIATLYNEANVSLQGMDLDDLAQGKEVDDIMEMSVFSIGEIKTDRYPIQATDFCKGPDLVNNVNKLHPEGGGGNNAVESYDLAAYFALKRCKTPNVPEGAKPLFIIAGDEGFYDTLIADDVRHYIGTNIQKNRRTTDVLKEVAEKYDTYVLRPEISYSATVMRRVHKQWCDVLGSQRVLKMDDPKRLVDCIIGICAYSADNFDLGMNILERRQSPQQVKDVLKTLRPLTGK